jgi:SNF2 family DNA or RNA helicase
MTLFRKGRKRYFNKITGYKNLIEFKETIDPFFLIRRTRDVADELPQLISRKLVLEMSEAQGKLYQKALSGELYQKLIKEKYFKFQEYASKKDELTEKEEKIYELLKEKYEESLTKDGMQKNKIAALSYCQLVSNGPGWLNEDGESSKETEFRRLFDQELTDEKVIVFTRFKSGIKRLSAILKNLGLKYTQITGDDSIDDRNKARKLFQDMDGDHNIIFITQAGSAAINLQAAGIILYYDTPWSYGDLYQSIGRAQRIGSIQKHILLLHMVNIKTIDEHVLDILDSKKDLINQVVGDIAEGALSFKDDEIVFQDDESTISALYDTVFKKVA